MQWYALRDNIDNMNTQEELIKLKKESGLGWKKFAESYGIPYRTVQDWYMGKRRMPEYLLRLMIYKAEIERNKDGIIKSVSSDDTIRKEVF